MPDRRPHVAAAALTLSMMAAACSTSESPSDIAAAPGMPTKWIAAPAGKFLLQGEILQKYLDAGASNSALGSPITSEKSAPGNGRYNAFEGGAIYWTPKTGAHIIAGDIRNVWEFDNDGPGGPLGYPTSDQQRVPEGEKQQFEHGVIVDIDGKPHVQADVTPAGR